MIEKEEIDKIAQIKGNVRGEVIQSNAIFIQKKRGDEGLRAIEKKMADFGHSMSFNKIRPGEWYPESLSASIILIARDLFNWEEKDVFEMGNFAPKHSFFIKIIMKYFISLRRVFKEIPNYWKKHLDFGELEPYELNEEKKYMILHEKNYKFHPLLCVYHAGYYLGMAQLLIQSKKINIQETGCMFKGDPYHEYTIRWE